MSSKFSSKHKSNPMTQDVIGWNGMSSELPKNLNHDASQDKAGDFVATHGDEFTLGFSVDAGGFGIDGEHHHAPNGKREDVNHIVEGFDFEIDATTIIDTIIDH